MYSKYPHLPLNILSITLSLETVGAFFLYAQLMGRALTAWFGSLGADGEAVSDFSHPNGRREGHSGWVLSKMKM